MFPVFSVHVPTPGALMLDELIEIPVEPESTPPLRAAVAPTPMLFLLDEMPLYFTRMRRLKSPFDVLHPSV